MNYVVIKGGKQTCAPRRPVCHVASCLSLIWWKEEHGGKWNRVKNKTGWEMDQSGKWIRVESRTWWKMEYC